VLLLSHIPSTEGPSTEVAARPEDTAKIADLEGECARLRDRAEQAELGRDELRLEVNALKTRFVLYGDGEIEGIHSVGVWISLFTGALTDYQ
jgi:hypothetical protein